MAEHSLSEQGAVPGIVARYGITAETIEHLSGGMESTSFLVNNKYVVTFLDAHNDMSAIWGARQLGYLEDNGIPVVHTHRNTIGHAIDFHGEDLVPVMVKDYVVGDIVQPFPSRLLPQAGKILSDVHKLEPPHFLPQGHRRLPDDWRQRLEGHGFDDLITMIEYAERRQEEWIYCPKALTHGDYFDDNILIVQQRNGRRGLVILDWEWSSIEPRVLDIAMAFIGLCRTNNELDSSKMMKFMKAYERENPLTPAEHAGLKAAVLYANAVLAYRRCVKHNFDFPNDGKSDMYLELVALNETIVNLGLTVHKPRVHTASRGIERSPMVEAVSA